MQALIKDSNMLSACSLPLFHILSAGPMFSTHPRTSNLDELVIVAIFGEKTYLLKLLLFANRKLRMLMKRKV